LVGGSTSIPKLKELLTNIFHKPPYAGVDATDAVAKGACIVGAKYALESYLTDLISVSNGSDTWGPSAIDLDAVFLKEMVLIEPEPAEGRPEVSVMKSLSKSQNVASERLESANPPERLPLLEKRGTGSPHQEKQANEPPKQAMECSQNANAASEIAALKQTISGQTQEIDQLRKELQIVRQERDSLALQRDQASRTPQLPNEFQINSPSGSGEIPRGIFAIFGAIFAKGKSRDLTAVTITTDGFKGEALTLIDPSDTSTLRPLPNRSECSIQVKFNGIGIQPTYCYISIRGEIPILTNIFLGEGTSRQSVLKEVRKEGSPPAIKAELTPGDSGVVFHCISLEFQKRKRQFSKDKEFELLALEIYGKGIRDQ
jgi:hypothetical protein